MSVRNTVSKKSAPAGRSSVPRSAAGAPTPQASSVYDWLRTDILAGELAPGQKLRIESIIRRYRTGQIPLREALNRLSSDGLVERRDQRGFLVAPVSADDLRELTKTRCIVEGAALRESVAARTAAWEEGIVLAYHRLSRAPRSLARDEYRMNPDWEPLHREFHLPSHAAAIELILEAIDKAGYTPGTQIALALDCAASEFYKDGHYVIEGEGGLKLSASAWTRTSGGSSSGMASRRSGR